MRTTCEECRHLVWCVDMWGEDEWCELGFEPSDGCDHFEPERGNAMGEYVPPAGFEICDGDPRKRPLYEKYHDELRAFMLSDATAISKTFENGAEMFRELERYRHALKRFGKGTSANGDLEGIKVCQKGRQLFVIKTEKE